MTNGNINPKLTVKTLMACNDPVEFEKLCMVEEIVEYEFTFYTLQETLYALDSDSSVTLGDAIAYVKTLLRERYRTLDADKVSEIYSQLFYVPEEEA